ncbi:hypothetical protein RB195_016260 [Necator americanus]|uniref:Zinc finger, ZZ type n=1 Tax=Necator americanus TaxID=51031 RepID=A0ABR1E8A9_NECAM
MIRLHRTRLHRGVAASYQEMEQISVKLSYNGAHRRFKIKGNNIESLFSDLMTNVAQLSAESSPFDIAWQDEDGDSIIISRPVELGEAIESRQNDLLRLHTIEKNTEKTTLKSENEADKSHVPEEKSQKDTGANDAVHGNVVCDLCDATIIGIRYKCILCVDYDLCQNCEKTGVHAHHGMVRIVDPMRTYVPWGARLRYTTQTGVHHRGHRSGDPHGVIHRFRMHEKREQLSEQVAKGMQYLTDIGQVVTSALANFGIDASYEVQVPEEKKEVKTEPKEEAPEEKKAEETEESKTTSNPPTAPKEDEPDTNNRTAEEKKVKFEGEENDKPPKLNVTKDFSNLQAAEEIFRDAVKKGSDNSNQSPAEEIFRYEKVQPPKPSESRRMQDAEVRKERHTYPPFGVGARGSLGCSRSWRGSHLRNPFEYRDTRDFDCYDERRRLRDEEDRYDEQKRTGDAAKNGRDQRRWWSSPYNDWSSPGRRNFRCDYDPFELHSHGFSAERRRSAENEEKAKGSGCNLFEEKNFTETKKPRKSLVSGEFCNRFDGRSDPFRRSINGLGELIRRNKVCRPAEEGLKEAVKEAARRIYDDDNNCRCFVTRMGRSPLCPACCRKGVQKSGKSSQSSAEGERMPAEEVAATEQSEKKERSESMTKEDAKPEIFVPKASHDSYDRCYSTDSSGDSDFEALSYESIPDEVEKTRWSIKSAPQPSTDQDVSAVVNSEVVVNQPSINTLYPTLNAEAQPVEAAHVSEDHSIASRLIDMGFSAEEVFRVVRMHGSNFERCIEEILAKEP